MRYIETWLTGLGLDYIIPKLKAQGITTPKKLAALSLRDIYEVVGVEDTEDRKKLYFLIRRLKSILKSKGGGDADDEEEEEEEPTEEPKEDSPTTQQKSIPISHKTHQKAEYVESKPAPEHEIVPAVSKTSPVEKPPINNAATIPETAESQEDLRRLRLNHRRQAQSTTSAAAIEREVVVEVVAAEVEEQEDVVTSKVAAGRVTRSSRLSVAPTAASKQPQHQVQQPQPSIYQQTANNVESKPVSRLTRLAPRQIPVPTPEEEPSHEDHATSTPINTAPSAVYQKPPISSKARPQTAPVPASQSNSRQNVTAQSMESWQSSAPPAPPSSASYLTSDDEANTNDHTNIADYTNATLRVVVRKRPLGQHEVNRGERDIIDVGENGALVVRDIKTKVDLTKVWQTIPFQFDDAFAEYDSNRTIYDNCLRSLLPHVLSEGMKVSCFTYGQTGSGKTYTMFGTGANSSQGAAINSKGLDNEGDRFGLYHLCMADVLHMIEQSSVLSSSIRVYLTCFEIYGEKLFDLLNNRTLVKNMEDAKQHVRIVGLTEHEVTDLDSFQHLLHTIVTSRSTSSTGANHDSSRSHQVLEVSFKYYNPALIAAQQAANAAGSISRRPKNPMAMIPPSQLPAAVMGKIVFVDLAGSEKAADTFMNAKSTRMEGADINTSLLALKEVFRSMEKKNGYMPFRGSKLTQVLKESLQGKSVRTCMIACVSPATSHYEQTMNTLRYAAKVYEVTAGSGAAGGTEVEEVPFVNLQDDHRIVYTAADFQEMQNAADVLAHHSSKHANNNNNNNNNRAVSAPRGGATTTTSSNSSNNPATRARSGSQSATNSSNNSHGSNRRISTSGLPKPSTTSNNNLNNNNPQAVNEARQLPLSRLLSSDDDHNNNNSDINNSHYTAEDEALPNNNNNNNNNKLRTANTNSSRLRAPATSHIAISQAPPPPEESHKPSLQRRNSFAAHTSSSNKAVANTVVVNDDAPQILSSPGANHSGSGKQLKRAISSIAPASSNNNSNLGSGLPRPKFASSSSQKPQPSQPAMTTNHTRKALPDYPESSDAYEEDEDHHHHQQQKQHQQQHQKHVYHVEPLENSYYASQAHETMESYLRDTDPEDTHHHHQDTYEDEEEEEYDDGGENVALDLNDEEGDEGDAGDEAQGEEEANDKTEELQMTWSLLSAHKLSIAEMVEVMKEEMELVQRMENVDERDTDDYLDTLQAILTAKSLAVTQLRSELQAFLEFRTEQRLFR